MDARGLFLTANTETIYNVTWFDTKDGPLVIEMPPGVLGVIDDFWFRFVTDIGPLGPDKGNGGKFLLLPPGYTGDVPDGYFVLPSRTYGHWCFFSRFHRRWRHEICGGLCKAKLPGLSAVNG